MGPHKMNRRRFLQILAAAPFAPWEEIVKEIAKPKIFYSIPKELPVEHIFGFSLDEACVQGIELEAFSKEIPDLLFRPLSI